MRARRRKTPIQRDERRSEPRAGKQKHEQKRVVEAEKRDSIRRLDAEAGQNRGSALDAPGRIPRSSGLRPRTQGRLARRERRVAFNPV
jgi:hypothetical protein